MKTLEVGQKIVLKDGRTCIIEDYDDAYYIVRDENGNTLKIKMEAVMKKKYELQKKMQAEWNQKFGEGTFAVMTSSDFFNELDEKIKFKEKWEKELK